MCHTSTGESFDRPITKNDLKIIQNHYQTIDKEILQWVYDRITDMNYPQPAVLLMIAELIYRDQEWDTWLYPVPVSPFSAMDLDTGERVQSKEMYSFHTVFESFALAQRNVQLLNNYLSNTIKTQIVLFCDCGWCSLRDDAPKEVRNIINNMNAFRSYYESIGTQVIKTESFDTPERSNRTLDMWESEKNSYKKMYKILTSLPKEQSQEPNDVYNTRHMLKQFRTNKVFSINN